MTAVALPAPVRRTPTVPWTVALLMPIGPAAIALLRFVLPYYTDSTSGAMTTSVAAQPGRESAVLWLGYVATLTLVPGVLALGHLTRAAAPRLTTWALALVVPAYLSLGGLLSMDSLLWSGSAAGVNPSTTASLLDHQHPTVNIALGVFVLGHVIGTVLLGVALLRSGHVPAWAALALAVSQPLHVVAAVIIGSNDLDLFAWSLTALGMAFAARALLQQDAGI